MQVFSLLINEVKLYIYRFLTSGAKKPKSNFNRSSLGSTGSLAIGVFNAWKVTVILDRTSTEKTNPSIGKEKLLEKRKYFLHLSTGPRLGKGNRSISTLAD